MYRPHLLTEMRLVARDTDRPANLLMGRRNAAKEGTVFAMGLYATNPTCLIQSGSTVWVCDSSRDDQLNNASLEVNGVATSASPTYSILHSGVGRSAVLAHGRVPRWLTSLRVQTTGWTPAARRWPAAYTAALGCHEPLPSHLVCGLWLQVGREAASSRWDDDDDCSESAGGVTWDASTDDDEMDAHTASDALESSTVLLRLQQAMTSRDVKLDAFKEAAQVSFVGLCRSFSDGVVIPEAHVMCEAGPAWLEPPFSPRRTRAGGVFSLAESKGGWETRRRSARPRRFLRMERSTPQPRAPSELLRLTGSCRRWPTRSCMPWSLTLLPRPST